MVLGCLFVHMIQNDIIYFFPSVCDELSHVCMHVTPWQYVCGCNAAHNVKYLPI